jgi:hypothetical protein
MASFLARFLICLASPVLMVVYCRNSFKKLTLVHVEVEGLTWEGFGH